MLRGLLSALCVAVATTAIATAGTTRTTVTTLRGTVGPDFSIKLTRAGKAVSRLQPGTYRVVVADRSPAHNFVLEKSGGASERQLTNVPFVGTKAITVTLTRGQWQFYCAPHASSMRGHFGVGAPAAATTTAPDDKGGHGADDGPNHT
jgi:plastocyanin